METVNITISINGRKQKAKFICDTEKLTINFIMKNGFDRTYSGSNFYNCFGHVREDNPEIEFLCKGSKINVRPSSMSSQMSLGVKAYELTIGKPSSLSDLVCIFDYEESDLTNDPKVQKEFYMRWRDSIVGGDED
jgi:hypothetical protein